METLPTAAQPAPAPRATPSITGSRTRWALITASALVLLLPLWIVAFPPLGDYPNHLASAFVIEHMNDPAYSFSSFYRAEWHAYPNLLMTLLFIAFGKLLPMEFGGRIVLSLCVLAVPLSAWAFLRAVNPAEQRQVIWALLLAYNPMFLRGFINYQFSISVCLVLLTLWVTWLHEPTVRRWLVLFAVTMLLYFTHLGGIMVAGVVMTAWLLAARKWRLLPATWALFAPCVALYYWSLPAGLKTLRAATYYYRLDEKAEALLTPWVGYTTAIDYVCCLLAATGLVYAWVRNPQRRVDWRLLLPTLALLAVFWFAPADPGASEANRRLMPFIFLLFLGAAQLGDKGRVLVAMGVLIFCLRMADTTYNFVAAQPRLTSLAAAFDRTPPNARVMVLVENWRDPEYVKDSYLHFWAYGIIRRGWRVPSLFHRPVIHVLRLQDNVFEPVDRSGYPYTSNPDWPVVRRQYDYIWADGVPEFAESINKISHCEVSSGPFRFCQVDPQ